MRIIWDLSKAFVKEIIAQYPLPKPPYNTISSVVRILEKKGFVSHQTYGNTYQYFPLISQDECKRFYLKDALKNYFGDSFQTWYPSSPQKKRSIFRSFRRLLIR
jgi:predicted transcriptional regulator